MAFLGLNGKAALIASMDFRTIVAEMDIGAFMDAMAILTFIAFITLMVLITLIAMMNNMIQRICIAYPTLND